MQKRTLTESYATHTHTHIWSGMYLTPSEILPSHLKVDQCEVFVCRANRHRLSELCRLGWNKRLPTESGHHTRSNRWMLMLRILRLLYVSSVRLGICSGPWIMTHPANTKEYLAILVNCHWTFLHFELQ